MRGKSAGRSATAPRRGRRHVPMLNKAKQAQGGRRNFQQKIIRDRTMTTNTGGWRNPVRKPKLLTGLAGRLVTLKVLGWRNRKTH